MARTLSREVISTRQQKIVDTGPDGTEDGADDVGSSHRHGDWLAEAYRRTRKDGAVGVDGVTAKQYEERLTENLEDLLSRFKSGRYRAPPVRRVHIPKGWAWRNPAHWHTNAGGQGFAAGGVDGVGADL